MGMKKVIFIAVPLVLALAAGAIAFFRSRHYA
jgi:flagellar basal body-associated protein FliL